MIATTKPLDPEQFELQYPRYVYRSHKNVKSMQWREAALNFESECRQQREQIATLRETLRQVEMDCCGMIGNCAGLSAEGRTAKVNYERIAKRTRAALKVST